MNDEILESVRDGFAPVHMDRPLEAIEARGRAHRRNRMLTGVAGMGLAVGLGLTLVLSTTDLTAHRGDNVAQAVASTPPAGQRMELASFALSSAADGTVKVSFKEAAADPKALEKALADAGISAMVRVNERCAARGGPTPGAAEGVTPRDVVHVGFESNPVITINGADLPKSVTLGLSLFVDDTMVVRGLGPYLFVTGSPVTCKPWSWSLSKATR